MYPSLTTNGEEQGGASGFCWEHAAQSHTYTWESSPRPWRMLVLFGQSIALDRTVRNCTVPLGAKNGQHNSKSVRNALISTFAVSEREDSAASHCLSPFPPDFHGVAAEFVVIRNCQIWLHAQYSVERMVLRGLREHLPGMVVHVALPRITEQSIMGTINMCSTAG